MYYSNYFQRFVRDLSDKEVQEVPNTVFVLFLLKSIYLQKKNIGIVEFIKVR